MATALGSFTPLGIVGILGNLGIVGIVGIVGILGNLGSVPDISAVTWSRPERRSREEEQRGGAERRSRRPEEEEEEEMDGETLSRINEDRPTGQLVPHQRPAAALHSALVDH
ncbi:unnamed protein product [Pleuronectes platessa]|uniref:Uncharacterized protein n=1 Tax=Pleuronectes platessa TaxID=8262 RepID=A0A9N7UNT2_PLEPL|nr:unnamed protein product [Pleuronectes platessa]